MASLIVLIPADYGFVAGNYGIIKLGGYLYNLLEEVAKRVQSNVKRAGYSFWRYL